MKIIMISNQLGGGGSERVLVSLANGLTERENDVLILCLKKGTSYAVDKGIQITYLNKQKNKLRRIIKIRETIKRESPDCVIAFEYFVNMQTIIAGLGLKNKMIISERNDPKRKGGTFPKNLIRNFLYRFCDMLVCQTPDAKAYFPKAIQRKAVVIPNPLKENLPLPWQGEREHRIVNFCRLEKQKNLPLLIDAFAGFHSEYRDYRLEIYGDGSEREKLQKKIDQLGLSDSVTLFPAVSDIHQRVLKAAMFVSTSDYEGLSNSMLEAMAIGLPVICTDCPCGGAKMMIKHEVNGLLVPVGDVDETAKAMRRCVVDSAMSKRLSRNAAKIREELNIKKILSEWQRFI